MWCAGSESPGIVVPSAALGVEVGVQRGSAKLDHTLMAARGKTTSGSAKLNHTLFTIAGPDCQCPAGPHQPPPRYLSATRCGSVLKNELPMNSISYQTLELLSNSSSEKCCTIVLGKRTKMLRSASSSDDGAGDLVFHCSRMIVLTCIIKLNSYTYSFLVELCHHARAHAELASASVANTPSESAISPTSSTRSLVGFHKTTVVRTWSQG